MHWLLFFLALWSTAILTGCGGGQSTAADPPAHSAGQLNPPASVALPLVLVTVTTDYALADQVIRFVQEDGDDDFLPSIWPINQGFHFQFALPKGHRYQLWFADTPSIDEPVPYVLDLRGFSGEILELPLFQFVYHP